MKRKFFVSIIFVSFLLTVLTAQSKSQPNEKHWAKLYEEPKSDVLHHLLPLNNGDLIIAGWTNAEVSKGENLLLMKISEAGEIIWQYSYGEADLDYAQILTLSSDNQIVVGGNTRSFGVGSTEILLLKISPEGQILWQKAYGTYDDNSITSIVAAGDGGFIVGGWSYLGRERRHDAVVFKTDSEGNILWSRHYGTENYEGVRDIVKIDDGNFIFVGLTSTDSTQYDIWLVKINQYGEIIWQKSFVGIGNESPINIHNFNGNYLIVGTSDSFGDGTKDIIMLAINENGDLVWAYNYPDSFETYITNSAKFKQNKILTVGSASKKNPWNNEFLLAIFNTDGELENGKLFGGTQDELGYAVADLDGSIVAGGYSYSFSNGNSDIILIKTNDEFYLPDGLLKPNEYSLSGNPVNINLQEVTTTATIDTTSLVTTNTNFQVSNPNLVMRNLNTISSTEIFEDENNFTIVFGNNQNIIIRPCNQLSKICTIEILNILGQCIQTIELNSNIQDINIPINTLPIGFYILRIVGSNKAIPFTKY